MAELSVIRAAARNNAEWCEALCRTHGITGRFDAECWTSPQRTRPLYPDAVTLAGGVVPARLLSQIDAGDGCSVKDSFADLDLTADGFQVLFRGEWLLRAPEETPTLSSGWVAVETREQLRDWELAWGASSAGLRLFHAPLLANAAIAVFARYDGEAIVSGAIANRSATVIGLSNVFDAHGDLESVWRDAASAAQARWGSMPVVGYDSGEALDAAHGSGFARVGELAVWVNAGNA